MNPRTIKIEAEGDFPFTFYIEKAMVSGTDELMSIKGVASTVNIDHDNERMAPEALQSMAQIINESSVPLRVEHQKDKNAIVGNVHKAWVDERNQLWIEANLDKSHPAAGILYKSLKEGVKLGLSVGGRVKHAAKEFSEAAGKMVKTFYQVVLDEVSVTQRPANYDAWLLAKSIVSKDEDTAGLYESPLYKDFIFETRGMDYMHSFAKSVPDKSWKRVELSDSKNKSMKDEETKKNNDESVDETKKSEDTKVDETKEKAEGDKAPADDTKESDDSANKSEDAFKSMVVKGLESLTAMMGKFMSKSDADDKYTETEKSGEETTIMEEKTESDDGEKKDKSLPPPEAETKEKAEDDKEDTEKNSYGSQYKMKSVLEKLSTMHKAMDDETGEKGDEETTKSQKDEVGSLDAFVATIEKSVAELEEKFTKKGFRVPGLTEQIVNLIQNDAEIQKSVKEMLQEPGAKKSVSMGTPFIKNKDGRMFKLTVAGDDKETVQKNQNSGKTFKDVYKTDYSSVAQAAALEE